MSQTSASAASIPLPMIAFIGGGNMASAIIGGLIRQGHPAHQIEVVEPWEEARVALQKNFTIQAQATAGPALARAGIVVWAVKPQTFKDAAAQAREHTQHALHLSVAAGIRSDSISQWLGSDCIVRTMPNTPALVGKGMSALYARAGTAMGLTPAQAHQLAVGTFVGASELARQSDESPQVLRQRVTSKGGTTYAALQSMEQDGVGEAFVRAMQAAQQRAHELGNEFGA